MISLPKTTDFLVIGGGVMGVTLALNLKNRFTDSSVTLIEKEEKFGMHASGRNSGVLHAGFYYTADSLKARFTREGNRAWTKYCQEKELAINQCGKLVVAKNGAEVRELKKLHLRGIKNDVDVELISASEAIEIEPRAKTIQQALFSPTTSSVNPSELMRSIVKDAEDAGIRMIPDVTYLDQTNNTIRTNKGSIQCGYIVNTAGLYADRIAKDFGYSEHYTMLPFKGLYLHSAEPAGSFNTHIYPVPDLNNPFLGVHVTVSADQTVHIGPTAIPALWRENYHGLANFKLEELVGISKQEVALLIRNDFDFRRLALSEIQKYRKNKMVDLASELATGITPENFKTWGKPGIRAQLLDTQKRTLVNDFLFEGDNRSFHLLNAVSPAFTCALPFSSWLGGKIQELINKSLRH